jgi:hypothetical protein
MHPIKQVPPAAMTAAERRAEIASLLANGLVRLRAANARASWSATAVASTP